jgi:glycosyltransferase involved in cell wall biosynthesis
MSASRWVLITGEYPPTPGGVSDYSRLVAHGLAQAGDQVHIWAPAGLRSAPTPGHPNVQHIPGGFSPPDLEILDRFLNQLPKPCRLLVQYVPQAFGCKGMNIPFCWWLSRRPEPVWIVFHEVVFPISSDQPLTHNILGMVTRLMVTLAARRAERIFITIPSWEALLPRSPSVRRRATWLAVPSNIPTAVSLHAVNEVRRQLAPAGQVVIGHFGTYGPAVTGLLRDTLIPVLRKDPRRRALLVGRDSERFAVTLGQGDQALQGQIEATGSLEPDKIAAHLAACDCLVQPFIDGVSSRRTSLMAGLALGLPIVTNAGPLTDPVWKNCKAVILAPSPSANGLRDAVEDLLLTQPKRLSDLRRQAAAFYQTNFALSHVIQILRAGTDLRRLAS